jgi:Holliday junction resolvasome RuvABC ATP-dependent DNA helicase subunit
MRLGFLERTPRGRQLTAKAYEHLGFKPPASQRQKKLF